MVVVMFWFCFSVIFLSANIEHFIVLCKFFTKIMLFNPVFFLFFCFWSIFSMYFVDFFAYFVDNLPD